MVNEEWSIAKSNLVCCVCQAKFSLGQAYYSALLEEGTGFRRHDYCLNCFQEPWPPGVFYYWKTVVPEEAAKAKPLLDTGGLLDFFRRLSGERDKRRAAFRYILALLLSRKKVLKFSGGARGGQGEELLTFVERAGGERHEVLQPNLGEQELADLSQELGRLLGLGLAPAAAEPAEGPELSAGDPALLAPAPAG